MGDDRREDPDALFRRELGIPSGTPVHRVVLSGPGGGEAGLIRIGPGDVVVFTSEDHRLRMLEFPDSLLASSQREFLRRTGQTEPPPLTDPGSRWILSFAGAPEGTFPYRIGEGGSVTRGEISVSAPAPRRGLWSWIPGFR